MKRQTRETTIRLTQTARFLYKKDCLNQFINKNKLPINTANHPARDADRNNPAEIMITAIAFHKIKNFFLFRRLLWNNPPVTIKQTARNPPKGPGLPNVPVTVKARWLLSNMALYCKIATMPSATPHKLKIQNKYL